MYISNPSEKRYQSANHMIYSCQYHVIFCPKYRRKVLVNGIDERLKELFVSYAAEHGFEVLEMEVMPDHVHLLLDISPDENVRQVISCMKGYTSHVLRSEYPELVRRLPCLWTRSVFISTVGAVSLEVVKKYIEDQKGK